jgi:hypothetical protein
MTPTERMRERLQAHIDAGGLLNITGTINLLLDECREATEEMVRVYDCLMCSSKPPLPNDFREAMRARSAELYGEEK